MNKRYIQANKEAKISLFLTICYLLAWGVAAYCLSGQQGIFGLPIWFEVACIFVPIGFTLAAWLAVKFLFKNISLESDQDTK